MNAPDAARPPACPDPVADDDGALRARLVAAFVHPVKACAPRAVPKLAMDAQGGAADDRRWVVLDAEGAATWMGAIPALAKVRTELVGDALCLRAAGRADLRVPAGADAGGARPPAAPCLRRCREALPRPHVRGVAPRGLRRRRVVGRQ